MKILILYYAQEIYTIVYSYNWLQLCYFQTLMKSILRTILGFNYIIQKFKNDNKFLTDSFLICNILSAIHCWIILQTIQYR